MTSTAQQILVTFTSWMKVKFRIHTTSTKIPFFREREVWWAHVGANVGHEQDGKNANFERPILVVRKFNQYMFWGIPQSSVSKSGPFYYQTTHQGRTYSLLLSQLRVFSSKRLIRKIRTIPKAEFAAVKTKTKALL